MKLLTVILLLSTSANAIPYVQPHPLSPAVTFCLQITRQAQSYCSVDSKDYNIGACEAFRNLLEERGCGSLDEPLTTNPSTSVATSSLIPITSLLIATSSPSEAAIITSVQTSPTFSSGSTPTSTNAIPSVQNEPTENPIYARQCQVNRNMIQRFCPVDSKTYNRQGCDIYKDLLGRFGCAPVPSPSTTKPSTAVATTSPVPANPSPTASPTPTPPSATTSTPSTANTIAPAVQTGPGICAVYREKMATIVLPTTPRVNTPAEYNFGYEVLRVNDCQLPSPAPCCTLQLQPQNYDSTECAAARREIYAVEPYGTRYQSLYGFLQQEGCRYLPPSETCVFLSNQIEQISNRETQSYKDFYYSLVRNSCYPLPAPPT